MIVQGSMMLFNKLKLKGREGGTWNGATVQFILDVVKKTWGWIGYMMLNDACAVETIIYYILSMAHLFTVSLQHWRRRFCISNHWHALARTPWGNQENHVSKVQRREIMWCEEWRIDCHPLSDLSILNYVWLDYWSKDPWSIDLSQACWHVRMWMPRPRK